MCIVRLGLEWLWLIHVIIIRAVHSAVLDVLADLRDTFNLACVLSSEEARTSVSLADHWEVGRERSCRLNLWRQVSFLFLHATVQVLSTYLLVVLA